MEIKPNKGIGNISFGMSPKDVKDILGFELTYEEWMDGNLNDSLYYPNLVIGFNLCDFKEPLPNSKVIGLCIKGASSYKFNSIPLAELNKQKLLTMVIAGEKPEIEENGDVYFKKLGVSFNFKENGLIYDCDMWQSHDS